MANLKYRISTAPWSWGAGESGAYKRKGRLVHNEDSQSNLVASKCVVF